MVVGRDWEEKHRITLDEDSILQWPAVVAAHACEQMQPWSRAPAAGGPQARALRLSKPSRVDGGQRLHRG